MLEMSLTLNWYKECIISSNALAAETITFTITGTKLYVSVVTLSTQGNVNLFEQVTSSFKRMINWNKY